MSDATRFAMGIAILVGAMIGFFFAFHPGGVQLAEQNPAGILKWIMNEISASNLTNQATTPSTTSGPQNVGSAPTATGA